MLHATLVAEREIPGAVGGASLNIASVSDQYFLGDDWVLDGSNKVQTWNNRGGLGSVNATEATNRPAGNTATLNGHHGATGNGTNTRLIFGSGIAMGANHTFAMIASKGSGLSCLLGFANSLGLLSTGTGGESFQWFADGNRTLSAGATGGHLVTITHADGGQTVGYFDGTQVFSVASSTTFAGKFIGTLLCRCSTDPVTGNDLFTTGTIFAYVHCPSVLGASDLSSLNNQLKAWGGIP